MGSETQEASAAACLLVLVCLSGVKTSTLRPIGGLPEEVGGPVESKIRHSQLDSKVVCNFNTEDPKPSVEQVVPSASSLPRVTRSSSSLSTKSLGALPKSAMSMMGDVQAVVPLPANHNGDLLSLIFHNLLRYTLQHFATILIFHDESLAAQEVIQNYLRSETERPIIVSLMNSHEDDDEDQTSSPDISITQTFPILNTNTENETNYVGNDTEVPNNIYAKELQTKRYTTISTVCVIVFEVSEVVESFFASANPDWFPTHVVLVSLDAKGDFRPIFSQTTSFRNVVLLRVKKASGGEKVLEAVTHKPFAPTSEQITFKTFHPGVVLQLSDIFVDRFDDFNGHRFGIASWIDDFPYLYLSKNKTALGLSLNMLDEIAPRLNFTYELSEITPDGFWGELVNGTWRGMIGELVRNEKTFVVNNLMLLLDRSEACDFALTYGVDSYGFVIKIPPPVPRWLAMVRPFDVGTWVAILASICVLAISFHLLVFRDSAPIYSHKADVFSSALWILRAVLRQSVTVIPSSPGSKVFIFCWWIAALVISTSYMGNLIAFITVPAQAQRLRTLSQLAYSDFKINMLDYGNFVPGALKSSREPVLRTLGNKLSLVDSYNKAIDNMDGGDHALLEGSLYLDYFMILRKKEMVYFLEEAVYPGYTVWYFRKDTAWKYKVEKMMFRMTETGLFSYWRRKCFEDFRRSQGLTPERIEVHEDPMRPLNLEDLQGAFLVFFLGVIASLLTLLIEACLVKLSDD